MGEHTTSSYVRKIFLVNISVVITKELLLFLNASPQTMLFWGVGVRNGTISANSITQCLPSICVPHSSESCTQLGFTSTKPLELVGFDSLLPQVMMVHKQADG